MTATVETTVITMYGTSDDFIISHDVTSPTAAGINISGMISIRNILVSLTDSTGIIPVFRHINIITIP